MERRLHMVAIGNDGGRMFDSVRYRMYATEDDVILDGTMARIKLEYRAGDIAYGVNLPQPFDMGLVEDEAMKFDPGKPVGMPPVWLIVCGEATPEPGCLPSLGPSPHWTGKTGRGTCMLPSRPGIRMTYRRTC